MTQLTKKESMTSLELLKEINIFREKERELDSNNRLLAELRHDSLLRTIKDEFSEEISVGELVESSYYSNGRNYPMFILTFSQSKQVLLKESKKVRKSVLQYIENLENKLKEVIPQLSEMEMIIKIAEKHVEHDKKFIEIENKIDSVINTVTLESNKQRKIQLAVAKRVYKLLPDPQPDFSDEDAKIYSKKLFSNLHRDIKRKFGVASYKDIKVVEYEKALNFIEQWIEDVI